VDLVMAETVMADADATVMGAAQDGTVALQAAIVVVAVAEAIM
jgi:hypothetical protein